MSIDVDFTFGKSLEGVCKACIFATEIQRRNCKSGVAPQRTRSLLPAECPGLVKEVAGCR
jgi:hypothetical protein